MAIKKLLLFSILLILASCKDKNLAAIETEAYSIFYPKEMKAVQHKNDAIQFYIFIEKEDDFNENINLLVQDLSQFNYDLDSFARLTETQMKTVGKLIESKKLKINGSDCQKIVAQSNMKGYDLKFYQYDFVKNNKAYILTFTCKSEDYKKFEKTAEKIMNSFTLK